MFHLVVETDQVPPNKVDCDSEWKPTSPQTRRSDVASSSSSLATPEIENVLFTTGNPSVDTVKGTIHLYKNSTTSRRTIPNSKMLCILAVPSYISANELVRFVCGFPSSNTTTATTTTSNVTTTSSSPPPQTTPSTTTNANISQQQQSQSNVKYIRLLRDSSIQNRYMAILMFLKQETADDFFVSHSRRRFNPLETEEAQIFYVCDIEIVPGKPYISAPDLTELPTCPVCLERMDTESTGLLTILCNHSFHGECLAQWKDSGCPVCRYALQPLGGVESSCLECECTISTELWICLVCGHVGCGRGVKSHALDHYNHTRHTYALNLETKRVWDYVGDNYVHRIVQAKADGKLVEVGGGSISFEDWKDSDKAVSLELEYSNLVQEHLATFERELNALKREHRKAITHLENQKSTLLKQRDEAETGAIHLREENRSFRDKMEKFESDLEKTEAKLRATTKKLTAMTARAEELEQINQSLLANQKLWEDKLKEVERSREKVVKDAQLKVEELEGQIRDLMFHIDAQQKIGKQSDLQQGDIITTQSTSSSTTPSHKQPSPTRRPHKR